MSERTTRHPKQSPCCGYTMDAASPAPGTEDDAEPAPGDFSICMRCGEFLRFGDGLALRVAGGDDIKDLDDEAFLQLQRMGQVIRSDSWQRRMGGRR